MDIHNMAKQGKPASHSRPVKKKKPYAVTTQSSSSTTSSSSSPSSSSLSSLTIRPPQPGKAPITTSHSRRQTSTAPRSKPFASTAFSARPSTSTTPSTRPTVVTHTTKLPSQSKLLPPARSREFYHPSPSPPSLKQQRPAPGSGSSGSQIRTFPSRASPKRPTSAFAPGTSPRKPNQSSRKISLSDLRIETMSVSSTASVDSTSSADSDHPETRAPRMQTTPVDQPIKTFLRIRPSDKSSSMSNDSTYLGVLNDTDVLMVPPQNPRQRKPSEYTFTRVFDETATQSSIFEETCLPLLTPILRQDNYKALVFSHGVAKSGKTHSTIGSSGQAGIIPRTLKVLFDSIVESTQDVHTPTQYRPFRVHDVEINVDELKDSETMESIRALDNNLATWIQKLALEPLDFNAGDLLIENQSSRNPPVSLPEGMNYSIWISCAEIFSERIYDLLAAPSVPPVRSINSTDPKRPQLFLTTDNATHQKYIQDLREVNVRTLEEAMMVLRAGYRQRQLYAALTNKPSPRSHCIVTIKVLKTPQFGESAMKDAAKGKTSISRLSIVDLAGSELLRTATSNAGHEVKDLGNGDTSLVVLGHCLKVLRANHTTNSKNPQEVPYRQSKLTQLFQGSLQASPAHSQVRLIVNINPYRSKFDEVARTLEFATTPTESLRTRIIMDAHRDSKALLNNTKQLSTNPTSAAIVQTIKGSSEQHDPEDIVMLSRGQKETSDMELDDGNSWVHPIEIGSKEMVTGKKEEHLLVGQGNATNISRPKHCMSVECLETIANIQEEFDRHREAFMTQDNARNQEFEALNDRLAENVRKLEVQKTRHQFQDKEIWELKAALAKNDADRVAQETLHGTFEQEINSLKEKLVENERSRKAQEEELRSRDVQVQELKDALKDALKETIANRDSQETIQSLHLDIKSLTAQLLESAKKGEELEERVRSRDVQVQELKDALTETIANQDSQETIQSLHLDIKSLTAQLLESTKRGEELEERVRSQDEGIQHLKQQLVDADAHRVSQQTLHETAIGSLEAEIQRFGTELGRRVIERREYDEVMNAKVQALEDELVSQTRALADSLNTNHNLAKVQGPVDQELTRLRDALASSDKKCRALSERLESGDRDHSMIVLVRDLERAEDAGLRLERELAKANETISAWDAWFAASPAMKLARVTPHASVPEVATVTANDNLASDGSLSTSDPIQADSALTDVLGTIRDAGDQAVLEEDFVEHIDATMASQDKHQNDPQDEHQDDSQGLPQDAFQDEQQGDCQIADEVVGTVTTKDCTEAVATEQIESPHIRHGNKSMDLTPNVKAEACPTASGVAAHPDFINLIEIESDSEDDYHATFKQRRISARLTQAQHITESSAESSRQPSSDASDEPGTKTMDSKSSAKTRTSTRSRSLPGHQETSTTFTSRSPPVRVTRSRYSLPNNPTISARTRSAALQPPIKKMKLSTDTKLSLISKDSDIEENEEYSQEDENVGSPLPQVSKVPTMQPGESVDSGVETTVIQTESGSSKATDSATAQEPSTLSAPETLQESNNVAAQGDSVDEDYALQPGARLNVGEGDQQGHRSPDFAPENDMLAEPSLEVELDDDMPERPAQNDGLDDYLQADRDEMMLDDSDDGDEERLVRKTPSRRMSLTSLIDDHIGTPAAEISPTRPLYPKLNLTTPSPKRTLHSPPSVPPKDGIAEDERFRPTLDSTDARLEEPKAAMYSPDRSHSSSPQPYIDVLLLAKQDSLPTTEGYSESPLRPYVDDDLDSDGERYHSLHIGDIDDDEEEESDGDKDLNGATSEYDSAQESLDTEESTESPLSKDAKADGKVDAEDKENNDPNYNRKKPESLSGNANVTAMAKGKMRSTDDDDTMTREEEESEEYELMKKGAMTVGGMRPKSKKRKLRPTQTVFVEEMNEWVDMHDQPAKNGAKQLHRKLKNKNKSKMY